uniref:Uncharacterized protein n=1 Tax=Gopherus evgoodei TaxID=1825980 RepID=A0A8C4W9D4_9SAUR
AGLFPIFPHPSSSVGPKTGHSTPDEDPSRKSAIAIQSWWRGVLTRRTVHQATLCVLVIQRWWRRALRGRSHWESSIRGVAVLVWICKSSKESCGTL